MELKYYRCKSCGSVATFIGGGCESISCCGERMEPIVPGSTDASQEKHVPVCTVENGKAEVAVGSVAHPMLEEHFIEWISLETRNGVQFKKLNPGDEPKATFLLAEGDEVTAVLAYCNLHSLWKA